MNCLDSISILSGPAQRNGPRRKQKRSALTLVLAPAHLVMYSIHVSAVLFYFSTCLLCVVFSPLVINPFTAKFNQKQISTKFPNFILWNFVKQIAPCVSTGRKLSFEWSHHRIWSAHSKVRVALQNSIKHSGSEGGLSVLGSGR